MTRILALLLVLLAIIVTPHSADASSGTCGGSPCSASYVVPGTSFNVGGTWYYSNSWNPYEGIVYWPSVRTSPLYSCPTSYGCYLTSSGVRTTATNPDGSAANYQFWANYYVCTDPGCVYKGWYYPRLNAGPW
jgi:hypothetical protein